MYFNLLITAPPIKGQLFPFICSNLCKLIYSAWYKNLTSNVIQDGQIVSCINVRTGEVLNYRDVYCGQSKPGVHDLEHIKGIPDEDGLVIRVQVPMVEFSGSTLVKNSEIRLNPDDLEANLKLLEELENRKGQVFIVKNNKGDRILTGGRYRGYHIDENGFIVIWFSEGRCQEISNEPVRLVPQLPFTKGNLSDEKFQRIKHIYSLASTDTVCFRGEEYGSSLKGKKVTCVDMMTGTVHIIGKEYLGRNEACMHEFSDNFRYRDNFGLVLREHKDVDMSLLIPSGEREIVLNSLSSEDKTGLENLNKFAMGRLYLVKSGDGKLITAGTFQGYHVAENKRVVLWFDNGRCVFMPLEGLRLVPSVKIEKTVSCETQPKQKTSPSVITETPSKKIKIEPKTPRPGGMVIFDKSEKQPDRWAGATPRVHVEPPKDNKPLVARTRDFDIDTTKIRKLETDDQKPRLAREPKREKLIERTAIQPAKSDEAPLTWIPMRFRGYSSSARLAYDGYISHANEYIGWECKVRYYDPKKPAYPLINEKEGVLLKVETDTIFPVYVVLFNGENIPRRLNLRDKNIEFAFTKEAAGAKDLIAKHLSPKTEEKKNLPTGRDDTSKIKKILARVSEQRTESKPRVPNSDEEYTGPGRMMAHGVSEPPKKKTQEGPKPGEIVTSYVDDMLIGRYPLDTGKDYEVVDKTTGKVVVTPRKLNKLEHSPNGQLLLMFNEGVNFTLPDDRFPEGVDFKIPERKKRGTKVVGTYRNRDRRRSLLS